MDRKDENKPEIWALLDGVSGHDAQILGVADNFKLPFSKKKIVYNEKAKRPNFLKLDGLATIDKKKSDLISAPWPDIIISCGRKSASVAKAIKAKAKKAGKKTFAAQILWPGLVARGLDFIATPMHDKILWPYSRSKKIFRFLGAPSRISKELLLNEYRIWARTIGELPSPRITVLVGGDSKKTEFNEANAKILVEHIVEICSGLKAAVLVTTSRRTKPEVSAFMENELKRRVGRYLHFHDFNKSKANPFYAFLQLADLIIVTGDSVSMASESCATGKPVYIFAPSGNASEKHAAFHEALYKNNFAQPLNNETTKSILKNDGQNKGAKMLNSALDIAEEIKKRSGITF